MNYSEHEALTKAGEAGSPNVSESTEKKSGLGVKRLSIVAVVLIVVVCVTLILNDVLRQKWSYKDNAAQQIVQGFYKEAPGSLDVLCLGASTVRNGVSPLEMYNEYGFTTYSRASSIQLPVLSYYLLQETLETQNLKAVVMDATILSNLILDQSPDTMAGKMHEAIDYMPWTKYKWRMIQECLKLNSSISLLDFVLPLYAYHDRWTDIVEDDFTYREWQNMYCYKGQYPSLKTVASSFDDDYMSEDEEIKEVFYLDESLMEYCDRIIDLCREKGVEFVLIKTPGTGWNVKRHELTEAYAQEKGVAFIDYNDVALLAEIGFDARTDFVDVGKHTNITGAKKISSHLGGYLAQVCDFEDKRQDPAYQSWNEDYEKYADLLTDVELLRETNLLGFLNKLDNPNYITMVSTRNDVSKFFNDDVAEAFAGLGIDAPFADKPYLSYLALLDGGKVVYQQADEDPEDNDNRLFYFTDYEGHTIQMSSLASPLIDNESSIIFDEEELSPSGWGFNIAVYDKAVSQFVTAKAFNTGKSGKNYTPPNPFSDYLRDPLAYLDHLANDDYITVIAASGESSRYMPGTVNDALADMGLIPMDKEFNRPYLAVLDGAEVVYNAYGEPKEEIDVACEIDGISVSAVSSGLSEAPHAYISIGGEEQVNHKYAGLTICVYSKSEQRRITANRFDWSANYTAQKRVNGRTDLVELLEAAKQGGYDVLCLYVKGEKYTVPSRETFEWLREFGFDALDGTTDYVGAKAFDGEAMQSSGESSATLECELGGVPVTLLAGDRKGEAVFDGVRYAAPRAGLYLFVYDAASRAVLTQARFDRSSNASPNPFADCANDPQGYLDLLRNDDYVAVMVAGGRSSCYMPGVVNDKLVELGLIPLDKEFNRPYVAVLNGGKAVCNEYGEPDTVLEISCEADGIPVSTVSDVRGSNAHMYVAVDDENPWSDSGEGLFICVYSKSEQRMITYRHFDWGANYTAVNGRVNGKTNLTEIIDATRRGGYDLLCLYAPAVRGENENSEEAQEDGAALEQTMQALRAYGFDRLSGEGCYAGIVRANGQATQASLETPAELRYELEGASVALYAREGEGEATFDGVTYAAGKAGLYVFVYDAANRAVLTQVRLDTPEAATPSPFASHKHDPLGFLEALVNEDYIAAIAVSGEGSRYMPGVVNDKLIELGLIPLDKEFDRPYIAILDGGEVIYNEYGEPGTELEADCTVADTPVLVISSADAGKRRAYFSIGGAEQKRSKKQTGLSLFIYSKSERREVDRWRFDWSNNYLSATKVNGVDNPLELLAMSRHAGYDVLCIANAGDINAMDGKAMEALKQFGFTQLDDAKYYAGVVYADDQAEQQSGAKPVSLNTDIDGVSVGLSAKKQSASATFFGTVEYASDEPGIHVYVYDAANKTVLTEVCYANQTVEEGGSENVSED